MLNKEAKTGGDERRAKSSSAASRGEAGRSSLRTPQLHYARKEGRTVFMSGRLSTAVEQSDGGSQAVCLVPGAHREANHFSSLFLIKKKRKRKNASKMEIRLLPLHSFDSDWLEKSVEKDPISEITAAK